MNKCGFVSTVQTKQNMSQSFLNGYAWPGYEKYNGNTKERAREREGERDESSTITSLASSRALVDSSRRTKYGFESKRRANARRCCSPSERTLDHSQVESREKRDSM